MVAVGFSSLVGLNSVAWAAYFPLCLQLHLQSFKSSGAFREGSVITLYCRMVFNSLGRHLCLVQKKSYLNKSFSAEVRFGVMIWFLFVLFGAKGVTRCRSQSALLPFPPVITSPHKNPSLSLWSRFFHKVRRGAFVFPGVSLLSPGSHQKAGLGKVSRTAVCFGWWVHLPALSRGSGVLKVSIILFFWELVQALTAWPLGTCSPQTRTAGLFIPLCAVSGGSWDVASVRRRLRR